MCERKEKELGLCEIFNFLCGEVILVVQWYFQLVICSVSAVNDRRQTGISHISGDPPAFSVTCGETVVVEDFLGVRVEVECVRSAISQNNCR